MPPVTMPPENTPVADTGDEVGAKLAILAGKIADSANAEGVGLSDRIDAFKVLTTYYVSTRKARLSPDSPDDEGAPSFGGFQQRIKIAASR